MVLGEAPTWGVARLRELSDSDDTQEQDGTSRRPACCCLESRQLGVGDSLPTAPRARCRLTVPAGAWASVSRPSAFPQGPVLAREPPRGDRGYAQRPLVCHAGGPGEWRPSPAVQRLTAWACPGGGAVVVPPPTPPRREHPVGPSGSPPRLRSVGARSS